MTARRLKFWGWGYENTGLSTEEERLLTESYAARFGTDGFDRLPVPQVDDIPLREPRLRVPSKLATICSTDAHDRLVHTYGKSFPDTVRAFNKDFTNAPDVVAFPENEEDGVAVLEWAADVNSAIIPFGGGSSVVGGVEPAIGDGFAGAISLDLRGLDQVLEIDKTSRAARIQAGILGPALEAALKPQGLTLRHFPQSFEFSTLGGWIATRSGGHFATLYTHIDDFVESVRTVTPIGIMESRRLPGSGAGPSPDRLMIGSEGALGVITEAWMRLQDRPTHRASASVLFKDFFQGAEAVRAVGQAGLYPANVRLLDANEARNTGSGDGAHALMLLAFESADHPVDAWMDRALEIVADFSGAFERDAEKKPGAHKADAAGAWRNAFIRMPYFREFLTAIGVINFTFETAITWDRFREFHDSIKAATLTAIEEATGQAGEVTCRFTHVYPDGPAPYFTVHGLGRHGEMLERWNHIKTKASDAVIAEGGTITHHHAVGRDHMPWYTRQTPDVFATALAAAKAKLDPAGILNPGVLVPRGNTAAFRGQADI